MNALMEQRRPAVAALCRQFGVERLEAFGSITRTDFDPAKSDVDFVVRFSRPQERGYADRYLDLAESLERLFGRKVDLLTERSLRNPILRETVARERQLIYGG